jgi:exodeoxyribonuclease-3
VKIATYNVNGVNGRLPVLLQWLAEAKPDIVVLQELKAPQEKFPAAAIRELGYDAIWHGQKSWNGVAILSRVGTIHETRRGLPGDPDPRRAATSRRRSTAFWLAGSICPMATRAPDRSSTTSLPGSSD